MNAWRSACSRVSRLIRNHPVWLEVAPGIVAPILCGMVFIVAAELRPGYSSLRQYGSELAVGPNGWLQTANFIAVGALEMTFALALLRSMGRSRAWRLAAGLVFLYGLGWLLVGLFDMRHARIHYWSTYLFVGVPAACLVLAPVMARDRDWKRLAGYTAVSGVLGFILALGWYVNHVRIHIPDLSSWLGLYQRLFYGLLFCWLEALALRLLALSVARREGVGTRRERARHLIRTVQSPR